MTKRMICAPDTPSSASSMTPAHIVEPLMLTGDATISQIAVGACRNAHAKNIRTV
jgi:uncharacterized protein with ACT and thioredoxin-like domain